MTSANVKELKKSLLSLVNEGFASWKGGKPYGSKKPIKIKGKNISDIVLENRR